MGNFYNSRVGELAKRIRAKFNQQPNWAKISALSVLAIFFIGILWGALRLALAADGPWLQTDWSGGLGASTTNQYSAASNIDSGVAGEFSLDAEPNWFNSDWQYRRELTFDNTTSNLGAASEVLTNFPVLVRLEDGVNIDLTDLQANGEDLRFADEDGYTPLDYEIESWDESGISLVWVNVPEIDANSNTDSIFI